MPNNTLRLNFCYFITIHILHPHYRPKIIGHTLKNKQKNTYVCVYVIMRVIMIKMKTKMKNRSHRDDISRPKSRHEHKYCKY